MRCGSFSRLEMALCFVCRRELHFSVQPGTENVERKTFTKTWELETGPLLTGDGGDVQKLTPIVRGTTAEIETRHAQLDDILVGLLNEATSNKGQAPKSGSVTVTSQRVTKSQPEVAAVREWIRFNSFFLQIKIVAFLRFFCLEITCKKVVGKSFSRQSK